MWPELSPQASTQCPLVYSAVSFSRCVSRGGTASGMHSTDESRLEMSVIAAFSSPGSLLRSSCDEDTFRCEGVAFYLFSTIYISIRRMAYLTRGWRAVYKRSVKTLQALEVIAMNVWKKNRKWRIPLRIVAEIVNYNCEMEISNRDINLLRISGNSGR